MLMAASGEFLADQGPRLHRPAPDFAARDQDGLFHRLPNLIGENGLTPVPRQYLAAGERPQDHLAPAACEQLHS